jgi:hypothetical protein
MLPSVIHEGDSCTSLKTLKDKIKYPSILRSLCPRAPILHNIQWRHPDPLDFLGTVTGEF